MDRWKTTLALSLALGLSTYYYLGTTSGRVRYMTWRMESSDPSVRTQARERLLELGRPAIDGVYPEIVAGEVADRVAAIGSSARVFVPRAGFEGALTDLELYYCKIEQALLGSREPLMVEASFEDYRWQLLCPDPLRDALARGRVLFVTGRGGGLMLAVPLPESYELRILEAVRTRLGTDLPMSEGRCQPHSE